MSFPSFKPAGRRKRRLIVSLILIALAPTIIGKTPARDWLINAAIPGDAYVIKTRKASLGYLTPMKIEGFQLQATDGSMQLDVEQMVSEKSWLRMLFSRDDLGTFRFRNPIVKVVTGVNARQPKPAQPANRKPATAQAAKQPTKKKQPAATSVATLPSLTAEIEGAGVQVRAAGQKYPTVDLRDLNFVIRVEQDEYGSVVTMDPTTVLQNEPLTPELCSHGVQLVAPLMDDVVDVQGAVTFRIDEFNVPVDVASKDAPQRTDISGMLQLSNVAVSPNNRISDELMPMLSRVAPVDRRLALTISRTMGVKFRVVNGRVYHHGMMFLLPIANSALEIKSSGSVGFDETLDLRLSVNLHSDLRRAPVLAQLLAADPLLIHVTGSIDRPKLGFESPEQFARRLEGLIHTLGSDVTGSGEPRTADGNFRQPSRKERTTEAVIGIVNGLLD